MPYMVRTILHISQLGATSAFYRLLKWHLKQRLIFAKFWFSEWRVCTVRGKVGHHGWSALSSMVAPYQSIAIIATSFRVLLINWFHLFKVVPYNRLINMWFFGLCGFLSIYGGRCLETILSHKNRGRATHESRSSTNCTNCTTISILHMLLNKW